MELEHSLEMVLDQMELEIQRLLARMALMAK
jgi:hypothetical protein